MEYRSDVVLKYGKFASAQFLHHNPAASDSCFMSMPRSSR
jgi:hypothetical protein